jgi:hypothetical protein
VKLALELERDRVRPGERAAGRIDVLEGGESRSLTLTVSFHEHTGEFDVVPYRSGSVLHEGDLPTGQTVAFDFTLPAEAPPSLTCEHSELYWQLEIVSDEPGFDSRLTRRLEVVA